MRDHVLGVDLGGSNARAVLSDLSGHAVADVAAATARSDAQTVVAQLAALSQQLMETADLDRSRIAAMAVGLPGAVDGGELRLAPNLPPFAQLDIASVLGEQLGVPIVVDNDVNLATLAEHRQGLGVGVPDFVFIAVGTGVGMGIVASGRIQRGATGAAGEIGFLPVGRDPFERPHHVRGSLEEAAGGVGVARRYAELTGGQPPVTGALDLFSRAAAGDPSARGVLENQARAIALAVVSTLSILDPALFVFGGGIGSREEFVDLVRPFVACLTRRSVTIEASPLRERAGLIGATELACMHASGPVPKHEDELARGLRP